MEVPHEPSSHDHEDTAPSSEHRDEEPEHVLDGGDEYEELEDDEDDEDRIEWDLTRRHALAYVSLLTF